MLAKIGESSKGLSRKLAENFFSIVTGPVVMCQDASAKLVRLDILTKVPKTILFCITLT